MTDWTLVAPEAYEAGILRGREMAKHDESRCQKCYGPNPVWSADNELWNRAMGNEGGFLCPRCFIDTFEAVTGERIVWRLTTW